MLELDQITHPSRLAVLHTSPPLLPTPVRQFHLPISRHQDLPMKPGFYEFHHAQFRKSHQANHFLKHYVSLFLWEEPLARP